MLFPARDPHESRFFVDLVSESLLGQVMQAVHVSVHMMKGWETP